VLFVQLPDTLQNLSYHHPAVQPSPAIELMQARDDKLYCRVVTDGKLVPKGEVKTGSRIDMPGQFAFSISDYLPHGRQNVVFEPLEADASQKEKAEPAAEIEVSAGGSVQALWLQRNHPSYGMQTIATPQGLLGVRFCSAQAPLGFSLQLVAFRREKNPGGVGNAAFASTVRLRDEDHGVDEERRISMNEPLTYRRLTFYQSSFNEADHRSATSIFSVAHDPGRTLKYAGSLMICLGIAIMFYMRAYFFKQVRPWKAQWTVSRPTSSSDGKISNQEPGVSLAPVAVACSDLPGTETEAVRS
jgi:hypothetical protein